MQIIPKNVINNPVILLWVGNTVNSWGFSLKHKVLISSVSLVPSPRRSEPPRWVAVGLKQHFPLEAAVANSRSEEPSAAARVHFEEAAAGRGGTIGSSIRWWLMDCLAPAIPRKQHCWRERMMHLTWLFWRICTSGWPSSRGGKRSLYVNVSTNKW